MLEVARALCDTLDDQRPVHKLSVAQSETCFAQTNSSHVLGSGVSLGVPETHASTWGALQGWLSTRRVGLRPRVRLSVCTGSHTNTTRTRPEVLVVLKHIDTHFRVRCEHARVPVGLRST